MRSNTVLRHKTTILMPLSAVALTMFVGLPLMRSDEPARSAIHVDASQSLGRIDPLIFGHFTEETLSSYEGGISSELLMNRKFEAPEQRRIEGLDFLFTGVAAAWEPIELNPSASFAPDRHVFYSPSVSQRITNSGAKAIVGIEQRGFRYVMPHVAPNQRLSDPFEFRAGETYRARLAIRNRDLHGAVTLALGTSPQGQTASCQFSFSGGEDWRVYQCLLKVAADVHDGRFMIYINSPGTIWVDSASLVNVALDDGGFRPDAMQLAAELQPTSIRWPGGWFVSDYDWHDAIGPIDRRPARFSLPWLSYVNNDIGVDEYVEMCHRLGAEPYICVNLETGTPEDAAALVEYTNGRSNTKWGGMRARNGHADPYRVKLWNLGNEDYLPTLGGMRGSEYARRFTAFANAMRAVDASIRLVAVGAFDPPVQLTSANPAFRILRFNFDWNQEALPVVGARADLYSIHYYGPQEDVRASSIKEMERAALVSSTDLNRKLDTLYRDMARYSSERKHLPIALDEWAIWLPKDRQRELGPQISPDKNDVRRDGLFGSQLTLRDALAEAAVYNLMQRRPEDFGLASRTLLFAYGLGLIAESRNQAIDSPSAEMLRLYATRKVAEALPVKVEAPRFAVPPAGGFTPAADAMNLDVSARRIGNDIDVFVLNRDLVRNLETDVDIDGTSASGRAQISLLDANDLRATNTFADPSRVRLANATAQVQNGRLRYEFPAHSLTRITVRQTRGS